MMLQEATAVAHPLSGSIAELVWLVPVLPLLGFVINGWLSVAAASHVGPKDPSAAGHDEAGHGQAQGHAHDSGGGAHGHDHQPVARHKYATLVSIIGPGVLALSFALSVAIFLAMLGVDHEAPFVRTLFSWMPAGDLTIDAPRGADRRPPGGPTRR